MVPRPEALRHSTLSLPENGQMARGYQCALLHAPQVGTTKRRSRAAFQNASVSDVMIGAGILRASAIGSLPLHDQRRAAVACAELHARALRERQIAILQLHGRMRFAAQLPYR